MKKYPRKNTHVLELSRETIRALTSEESHRVRGGFCRESDSFCDDTWTCNTVEHC